MDPLKKKIIIAFLVLSALGALCVFLLCFVDLQSQKREEIPQDSYDFYLADFDKNIFEDEEYMELNRALSYKEGATTVMITDEDCEGYNPIVKFFSAYIDTIIRGDYRKYNTFFTKEFLAANGEKGPFTMQQLYNIELEYIGSRNIELGGAEYPLYEVALEYMIRQNNGSFRNDMGSDAIRRQHFHVVERDGKLEILTVNTFFLAK